MKYSVPVDTGDKVSTPTHRTGSSVSVLRVVGPDCLVDPGRRRENRWHMISSETIVWGKDLLCTVHERYLGE